jgi:hypothetical protein
MKFNKWTLGLAAVGAVSLTSVVTAQAENGAGNLNPIQSALNGISISGGVDTSLEFALDPSGDEFADFDHPLAGVPFRGQTKQDGFNLNVVELNIVKPLDESEWAAGFNVQLLFGPDAVGYNPSANTYYGYLGFSDFSIKQAYVALRTPVGNGIDWKVGVFDTIIGYEVFESWKNPNFSRSWGYALEPTQHTGLLGTYRVNDNVSVSGGIANTLSAGINERNDIANLGDHYWAKTWLASVSLTAPDTWGSISGSSLYVGAVKGFDSFGSPTDGDVTSDRLNLYVGTVIKTPVEGLTTGLAFDHVDFNDPDENKFSNVGAYVSYKITEKMSVHGRGEYGWFSDDDDNESCWWGLTGTLQYDLWANVISRLEIRHENNDDDAFEQNCATAVYLNLVYVF